MEKEGEKHKVPIPKVKKVKIQESSESVNSSSDHEKEGESAQVSSNPFLRSNTAFQGDAFTGKKLFRRGTISKDIMKLTQPDGADIENKDGAEDKFNSFRDKIMRDYENGLLENEKTIEDGNNKLSTGEQKMVDTLQKLQK